MVKLVGSLQDGPGFIGGPLGGHPTASGRWGEKWVELSSASPRWTAGAPRARGAGGAATRRRRRGRTVRGDHPGGADGWHDGRGRWAVGGAGADRSFGR